MAVWYLDTSAAFKLLLRERESADLIAAISADRPTLVSSYLLETELRRAANRVGTLSQRQVTNLLDRVGLYELTPAMHTQAGLLPGVNLRSLDALHLATAISVGVDALAAIRARAPDLPVLILSGFPETHYATTLLRQGCAAAIVMPISSCSSRRSACSTVSSGSILPPGNSQ